jgi:hypothetical protein
MSTKPKTRAAPAKPSAFAEALARHKAAQAAHDAAPDQSDETIIPLTEAAYDAQIGLAKAPCASDAEFIEKLNYLFADETRICGLVNCNMDFGSVLAAVATHFGVIFEDAAEEGPSLDDYIGSEEWGHT